MSLASEAKQRQMAKTIVGDNLVAERGAFTFPHSGGEEVKETPFVYCPNLIAKVTDVVEHHRQVFIIIQVDTSKINNNYINLRASSGLTWHDGAIPADELWIKLGGDKGRGTFKFNFQLMNTQHPNSQKNTTLLSIFRAGDSITNLHTALDMYKTAITEMQGMKLKYVTVV